jgi:hypothetical protein
MEEAYDAAQSLARQLRGRMRGYRPDPALVVSACVMYAVEHLAPEEAEAIALAYLQRLFSRIEPPGDAEAQSAPDIPRAA